MKQLIVNADDFGYSPGINRGILESQRRGIVTSTTVMVNQAAAPAGIELALAEAPDLGLGLHITLTKGRPVLPPGQVPSLVDADGYFFHIRDWPDHLFAFDPDHTRREIEAQLQRFVSLTGRLPDHLDAHHHSAYLSPAALVAMLTVARHYNLPIRGFRLHLPFDETLKTVRDLMPRLPESTFRQLNEALPAALSEGPTPFWPARLETGFYGEHATLGDLLVILTNLPDGITEIMCHPGYVDDQWADSSYQEPRQAEVICLTHTATLECVKAEGIQLIAFGDVPRAQNRSAAGQTSAPQS
jgi:predicted glycoside hydrolase/deacetylase ChbG (UPF0249 family)